MDPIPNNSGNPDANSNQFDPSFQVMPQEGSLHNAPVASTPMPPPAPSAPQSRVMDLPIEEDAGSSGGSRKLIYIIVAVVVLLALGAGAYFLLGRKQPATQTQTAATQLPKVWLTQYFNSDVCADQSTCGDSADPDNDGLVNLDEFKNSTSPTNPDTDNDGLADGDEVHVYKTDPSLKYTDTRPIVATNNWSDGFQINGGYDPLTPGQKFAEARLTQIATDTQQFPLHEPTTTTLKSSMNMNISPTPAGSTQTPAPAPSPSPSSSSQSTTSVIIKNFSFVPATITVHKGDKVTWTNQDGASHTITGDTGGPASQMIGPNGTYSFTFDSTGTFTYHCSLHPSMTAVVIVN